jgi:hypothetical protein
VFGFDVSIEGRIRKVAQFACTADVLSTLLIFARLPHFLLFLICFALSFDIIFHHIVVDHIHAFV